MNQWPLQCQGRSLGLRPAPACAQAGGEKCELSAQVRGCPAVCAAIVTQRNPKALALLARGRARRKISDLEAALEGAEFFTDDHAALLAVMLGAAARHAKGPFSGQTLNPGPISGALGWLPCGPDS